MGPQGGWGVGTGLPTISVSLPEGVLEAHLSLAAGRTAPISWMDKLSFKRSDFPRAARPAGAGRG